MHWLVIKSIDFVENVTSTSKLAIKYDTFIRIFVGNKHITELYLLFNKTVKSGQNILPGGLNFNSYFGNSNYTIFSRIKFLNNS